MYMTRRQKEILDFLDRYIERKGYAPTIEETAEVLGVSTMTVKRDWRVARAWLHRRLTGERR